MMFIAGASGFVGQHLVRYLRAREQEIRCLVRSAKSQQEFSSHGVQPVAGDVTQPETLRGVLREGDFVIHLVGIIEEKGHATFRSIHVEGTANLVSEAQRAGIRHFFYQSALGADKSSWSAYLRTKAEAEDIVRQSGLPYTIFRPSLIIGPWDGFTKRLMEMLRLSPVLPIPGEGGARFQPVYINDWLTCIGKVIGNPEQFVGTFDIGGPEHLSYREIVETLSRSMGYSRPSLKIPMGLMKFGASIFERVLPSPPVTSDQLRLLEQDNISDTDAVERKFGFRPARYADALGEFMRTHN